MSYPDGVLVIDGEPVTVAVSATVNAVLAHWANRHVDDLDAALAPYGLTSADIAAPRYTRFVKHDETPSRRRP